MPRWNGPLFTVFIFTLSILLFPATSLAILEQEGNTNRESPYPSFLADIELILTDSSGQYDSSHGTGAFIAPNVVVTAAHVVTPPPGYQQVAIVVTALERGEGGQRPQPIRILHSQNAEGYLPDAQLESPVGSDMAVLVLPRALDVDVLHLPEEVGVTVEEHDEMAGTVYGQMIPDRERIGEAYDQLFEADGQLTQMGWEEFESGPDGDLRRQSAASNIILSGALPNEHRSGDGAFAPFVRIRIPRAPQSLQGPMAPPHVLAGIPRDGTTANLQMDRETFITTAYAAARRLPFHLGDSGAPLISRAPGGELYLAGVISMAWPATSDEGETFFELAISTGSAHNILDTIHRAHPDFRILNGEEGIVRPENVSFWADPNGNVPTLANWRDDDGLLLAELPDDLPDEENVAQLCSPIGPNHSDFCRRLRSEPTTEYDVRVISMTVDAPNRFVNPDGSHPLESSQQTQYRISGQIVYFSPQDVSYNSTTESPFDENPPGRALSIPEATPVRLTMENLHETESDLYFPGSSTSATITANETDPMFCIGTPPESGVFAHTANSTEVVIPGGQASCIVANETTRNSSDNSYDIHLEGPDSNDVTVTLSIELSNIVIE
ncbi:trypsin-like serine protease [Alcanivoracaceae bacterium MT1]